MEEESIKGCDLDITGIAQMLTEKTDDLREALEEMDEFSPDAIEETMEFTPEALVNQIPKKREDLNKMRTVVKIFNGKDNAGITLPGFGGLKLGKEETSLSVYYIETKVVDSSIVYGCGYSVHYLFKKVEKGINVANIPCVAASAQLNSNKTEVVYSIQTYGIKGNNLVKYFKPTINKPFDVEGFAVIQSSIDGIHNILGDSVLSETLKFEPEILKFVQAYELEQI